MGHAGNKVSTVQWYLADEGDGLPRGFWLNGIQASVTVISDRQGQSSLIWDEGGDDKIERIADDWGVAGSCEDFITAIDGNFDHHRRLDADIETLKIALAACDSASSGRVVRYCRDDGMYK